MRHIFAKGFPKKLNSLSRQRQEKFWKQLEFLLLDIRHPSLHVKKYTGVEDIWQARVDRSYRFYFLIEDDTYILLDIRAHPK